MRIKEDLSIFGHKRVLLVVAGKQTAKIYLIDHRELELIDLIALPNPSSQYTDREGHFEQRSVSGYISSGSVYEPKKEYLFKKFTKELSKMVARIDKTKEISEIYLFSPSYIKNEIKDSLKKYSHDKLIMEIKGNYSEGHPHDLIEKLKKEKSSPEQVSIRSEVADKLLKKKDINDNSS